MRPEPSVELAPLALVIGQFEIPQAVTAAAFAAARSLGAVTVLNPAPAADMDAALLSVSDWVIPNEVEFARLADASSDATDDEIAAFARRTGTRVVVTLGARGAALLGSGRDGPPDPGARCRGVRHDRCRRRVRRRVRLRPGPRLGEIEAVRLGVRCASDSVQRPGTQRSFPRAAALDEFLTEA